MATSGFDMIYNLFAYAQYALLLKNNYNILLKNFRYKSSIFRRGENIIRMFFTKYDAPCLKKYRKIN